jgi:hypothetical protein
MAAPTVAVVILNTNRREDTLACLASLRQSCYSDARLMVLDNASTDGSPEAIRAQFPEVQLLPLTDNRGYAGNNNIGIRAALEQGADWVLVLNEDTLLDPDCLSALVQQGESDPRIGIVGPLVYHANEPGVIQSAGGRLGRHWLAEHIGQNETDTGQFSTPCDVEWISGCAIMLRRALLEQIGLLDERFFYYWEETEWCLRASRAGWRIVHVPAAKLWHKGVQRDYQPGPSVTYYGTRNQFLLLSKHNAPVHVWFHAWTQALRTLVSWSIKPQWRSMRPHRAALWRGLRDFLSRRWGKMPAA